MLMLKLFLQVTGAGWLWPMLPWKVSSFVWLRFMCPISLRRGFPFFVGWHTVPGRYEEASLNAILDPKIDKVGRGASRAGRCESSLVSFVTRHGLVDRFRLDHPGREMWTWLDSSPSAKVGSYLDRVLVRRADIDFVRCPTLHLIAWTDHKLVSVSLRLANRPSLAGYWKFNTSLLEILDFRHRLESLIQRALVGAVTGNRWWVSLKYRIRDFATKYGQQLNLDKAKEAKSIDDKLCRAAAGGDSLGVELARRDLERESSERYKGHVVRSRLNRVLYEAVESNATAREEEVRRFPNRYIASVKTADERLLRSNREMRDAFRDRFARCPDLPIREFRSYLADLPRLGVAEAASCEGVVTECEVRDALKHVGLNKSPGLDGLPNEVYLRMSLFWRMCSTIGSPREPSLVALPRAWSHCWRKVAGMLGRV